MIKHLTYLISIIIIIGAYITYVASETVQSAASTVIWMVVSALGLLLLGGLGIGGLYLYMLVIKIFDSKTKVIIAPENSQVYLHNLLTGNTKAAHLNPNPYSNGHWETPTPENMSIFLARLLKGRKAIEQQQPLLIEGEVVQQRTIFDILKTGVHFSLIGATDAGKTSLASHIIEHLNYSKTYILSPHFHVDKAKGTWTDKGIPVQKYDDIQKVIQDTFVEMSHRYDNAILDSEPILLVIDEFASIMDELPDCEKWIARIAREGRKVGVMLIFMSQTDQINEIGFTVATRRNFTKIELVPELTQQNKGTIKHWDKSTEIIELAGPYQRQMTTEERIIDEWLKADKSDYEQAITDVTKIVYKGYGGRQRNTVKKVVKGLVNEVN